jgi:DNA polymerase-3 subunit alpha
MVFYFLFDVETNGLPLNYKADYTYTDNWPRIVQISWCVRQHDEKNDIFIKDYIVKPLDFEITEDTVHIHGITDTIAKDKGIPLMDILKKIKEDLERCDYIVSHNLHFDQNVLLSELVRLGTENDIIKLIHDKKKICTKLESIEYCKLRPYRYGSWKWPRLNELYFKLFDTSIDHKKAHNSKYDVEILTKCFQEMVKKGLIKTINIKELRNRTLLI